MTSNAKAEGRFGKQRLPPGAEEDTYIPADERLAYHYTNRRKWMSPAPLLDQSRLQDGAGGDCLEAARITLPVGQVAGLAQVQESGSTGGEA
jgi:hypothetical protein